MSQPPSGADLASLDLDLVVSTVRGHTGLTGKRPLAGLRPFVDTSDPVHGPGDNGAVVEVGSSRVIVCGEAISPPFVAADPYGAGVAAVLANVNDVAAMGGIPRAIVTTLVGPPEVTTKVMEGLRDASRMYDTPLVGGHLTERPGDTALSAFAIGEAERVLSMAHVHPGQTVLFACSLDGQMRADFPFFTSIERQGPRLARDVRLLAEVASSGLAVAAKDVSMAGPLGSLAMLLEFTRCGAEIDLERLAFPPDTDPLRWLISFPTYAFWLLAESTTVEACTALFGANGLVCTAVGTVDATGQLIVSHRDERRTLLDLARESVTGLWDDRRPGHP
jgi:selenophosphate synthetase-related protein